MSEVKTRAPWQPKEYDKEHLIASHFGFLPIEAPRVTDKDVELTRDCLCDLGSYKHKDIHKLFYPEEMAAFLRQYEENNFASLSHPLLVSYRKPKSAGGQYFMHAVGMPPGLAEAILIRAALSLLSESGYKNLIVEINSIGEKDSIAAHERELHNFLRKRLAMNNGIALSPETKKLLKKDIFNLIRLDHPELSSLAGDAPSPISVLTSPARSYFKEVLEYLEASGVEFRINPELVGSKNLVSHSIFTIKDTSAPEERLLALGYKYSRLSRRFSFKKEVPLACLSILTRDRIQEAKVVRDLPKPKFCLVNLGREAKLKVLPLLELLRVSKIPVYHFLGRDKITAQLTMADSLKVPYLLILGQKEALEGTVTIRNTSTRAQETVSLSDLAPFLKHITLAAFLFFHYYPWGF